MSEIKVLTISAKDYVESVGKKLTDYDMVLKETRGESLWNAAYNMGCFKDEGIEAIVAIIPFYDKGRYSDEKVKLLGTALIPKTKETSKKL